jgi:microcystin-dependent protein
MSEPFLGEIKIMAFGYAPRNWAMCNGQQLPINQNQALFSLLGTTYGGNGQTTFALPDLRGQTPIHFNKNLRGTKGGEKSHTLTMQEMTLHIHVATATSTNGGVIIPTSNLLAGGTPQLYHSPDGNLTALNPATIGNTGGSQPHENMQPFLTLNFCIALIGIFPSQN